MSTSTTELVSEAKKYITVDNLAKALGPGGLEKLQSLTISSAENFMTGQVTSAFAKAEDVASPALQGTVEAAGQVYSIAQKASPEYITSVAEKLTAMVSTKLTEECVPIVTNAVASMLKPPSPSAFLDAMKEQFNKEKHSLPDIFSEVTEKAEDTVKKEQESQSKKQEKDFLKDVNNIAANVKDATSKAMEATNGFLKGIMDKIQQGEDWVADKANKQVESCVGSVTEKCDEYTQTVNDFKDKFVKEKGAAMGSIAAGEYNALLERKAKKILNDTKKVKAMAEITAKKAIQKLKLTIMAKTGVNLPV